MQSRPMLAPDLQKGAPRSPYLLPCFFLAFFALTNSALAGSVVSQIVGKWSETDDGDDLIVHPNGDAGFASTGRFRLADSACGAGGNIMIYEKGGSCCYYASLVRRTRMKWVLEGSYGRTCKSLINFHRE